MLVGRGRRRRRPGVLFATLLACAAGAACNTDRDLREDHPDAVPFEEREVPEAVLATEDAGAFLGASEQLSARITDLPPRVGFGDDFSFVVVLENEGDVPYRLDPCPFYVVTLGEGAVVARRSSYLPCDTVPSIAPRASTRFDVELTSPAEPFSGEGGDDPSVHWVLRGMPGGVRATARVAVGSDFPTERQKQGVLGVIVAVGLTVVARRVRRR